MNVKKATLFLLITMFSFKTSAQELETRLSINDLMTLSVQKALENDRLKQARLSYKEFYHFEEFNYKGDLKSSKKSTDTITGKVRKLAGFNLAIGELLKLLTDRHQFSFGEPLHIIYKEKPALMIDFRPKENLRMETTEDKFINRLNGYIILDADKYSLLEVNCYIPETSKFSFRAWWGIFFVTVDVQTFQMKFEQIEFEGILVENKIEVETKFEAFGTKTRKYHYQYADYTYK